MAEEKKKPEKKDAVIICIWCYGIITSKEAKTHPCTQSNFLDSDKVKQAKMIHPSAGRSGKNSTNYQDEWKNLDDWFKSPDDYGLPWASYHYDKDCDHDE